MVLLSHLIADPLRLAIKPPPGAVTGGFVPLGWSNNGFFAALESLDPGQAAPLIFIRLMVFNTVEDTFLFDQIINADPQSGDPIRIFLNSQELLSFAACIVQNNIHIRAGSPPLVEKFPWSWQNIRFQPVLETRQIDPQGDGFSPKISWKLSIAVERAGKRGSKQITGNDSELATSVSVDGLIKNPGEARIVVLIRVHQRGVEGDTFKKTVLSGCTLDSRFNMK